MFAVLVPLPVLDTWYFQSLVAGVVGGAAWWIVFR